tara:strand:- start:881 stop:1348 length:468 start_codon:yes stop_codon:yes gene_type:complete
MEFYDLKNYEGLYQINKNGEIKNIKKNIIMKLKTDKGYLRIGLRKDKRKFYLIHRLLAIQFIENPNEYKIVDHIDNNPLNNDLENLRWITNSGNCRNRIPTGSSKYLGVNWEKNSKKWRANIKIEGKYKHLGYFTNEEDASLVYQKVYNEIMNIF